MGSDPDSEPWRTIRRARADPEPFERSLRSAIEDAFSEPFLGRGNAGIRLDEVLLDGVYPETSVSAIFVDEALPGYRFSHSMRIWDDEKLFMWGPSPPRLAATERMWLEEEVAAEGYGLPEPTYPAPDEPIPIAWHEITLEQALVRAPFPVLVPVPLVHDAATEPKYLFEHRRRFRARATLIGIYRVDQGRFLVVQTEGLHHQIPTEGWGQIDESIAVLDHPPSPPLPRWTAWREPPEDWHPARTLVLDYDSFQVWTESDALGLDELLTQTRSLEDVIPGSESPLS